MVVACKIRDMMQQAACDLSAHALTAAAAARAAPHPNARRKAKAKGGKSPKPGSAAFWSSIKGWKAVDVGDDFLLGAEEGGFAGLEILDNPPIFEAPGEPHGMVPEVTAHPQCCNGRFL